ncbi:hypothetical protein jhhlp_006844 [Lomentospora prolificans]|uniref:Uncharacterized protein n=1 Tax=Lomentospora prolificans TaxID=41688 RepID=A0A2N3N2W6_9PEZI|nr:hypothetical protein jhhlp_006844 [Lomentospora prolificans]
MSWMDSWSRPSKSQATPAPYYLLPGGENTPYCQSCGRLISQRRTNAAASAKMEARYCSTRCRHQKPGKLDREVENMFVRLLDGDERFSGLSSGAADGHKHAKKDKKGRKVKGDQRILVPCSVVEDLMFGKKSEDSHSDEPRTPEPETENYRDVAVEQLGHNDPLPEAVAAGVVAPEEKYIDGDVLARMSIRSGTRIRPPQDVSEVNGSVGGEKGRAERIEENEEMLEKRQQGLRRAKEKEMVRCAARRGVVFGFKAGGTSMNKNASGAGDRRLCEAVMNGKVVEPSFAKGDWSIRWRE